MLRFVLRKMAANRWMTAGLMAGVVLAVAMVAAIPVYTQGILGRLLRRDLQSYQERTGMYPGIATVHGFLGATDKEDLAESFDRYTELFQERVRAALRPEVQRTVFRLQQNTLRVRPVGEEEDDGTAVLIASVTGFFDRVTPLVGRLPQELPDQPNVVEVAITQQMSAAGKVTVGREYEVYDRGEERALPIRVRVVGVVTMSDPSDVYWSFRLSEYVSTAICHSRELREKLIAQTAPRFLEAQWGFVFDYQELGVADARPLVQFLNQTRYGARREGLDVRVPIGRILEEYLRREAALKLTLWVLQVPLLLMLGFYLFMVSQILVEHERNEIAIIKSRGGTTGQVFFSYVIFGLILALVGLAAGPFVGVFICRVLGASNGFLEFVRRRVLEVQLSTQAYVYAALAAAVAASAALLPTVSASRITIVAHKRSAAERRSGPRRQTAVLGVALVAVGVYGLYRYRTRNQLLALSGLEALEVTLDPVLLFVSTLFSVGLGIVFLQVYPLLVKALYRMGKRAWPPVLYAPLVQVAQGSGRDRFLMLFLILSISIGVYNADAARTLNQNTRDRVRYAVGADLVLKERWIRLAAPGDAAEEGPPSGFAEMSDPTGAYVEPDFQRFGRLPGVAEATKVLRAERGAGSAVAGERFAVDQILAIIPDEFGRVAWYRPDLLPTHWYHYLNALASDPQAALVSRSLMDSHGLQLGDQFYLRWGRQPAMLLRIYGFVDFWPTFLPYGSAGASGPGLRTLVVANFNYAQAMTAAEPYEVWIRTNGTASTAEIYDAFGELNIRPERVENAQQALVEAMNDAQLQGINGSLTLGFLLSLAVCFAGFVIYWIFSIGERTLQFGLFRAMGLGKATIVGMLAVEQLLISGAAVAAGFGVGRTTAVLFVPLLQTVRDSADTVPPFRVVSWPLDHVRIAAVVTAMLVFGFAVLAWFIAHIRIHQAVKLGEE
jgi:putative ABC transport system permease protein